MKLSLGLSPRDYSVAGGVTYDADAQAYFTANTAITTSADKNAINTFYLGLKSDGIYTKIKAMYLPIWGSAASCKWNLKDPRDLDAAFRLSFATGMTFTSSGMTSNGSSGYANTNFIPNSNLNIDSTHISFYSRTSQINSLTCEIGCSDNANELPSLVMYVKYNDGNYKGLSPDYNLTMVNVANTDSKGFYIDSRTANNSHKAYKNNTTFGTNTATRVQTLLPQRSMYLLAYNYFAGTPAGYSGKQCAFASIGDGLTDAEASNFYTRVNTLMTYFGINV